MVSVVLSLSRSEPPPGCLLWDVYYDADWRSLSVIAQTSPIALKAHLHSAMIFTKKNVFIMPVQILTASTLYY